jgi:hypothetical protein
VALMGAFAAIRLGQFNPVAFDPIDGPDRNAIRANDFHAFFNVAELNHSRFLL